MGDREHVTIWYENTLKRVEEKKTREENRPTPNLYRLVTLSEMYKRVQKEHAQIVDAYKIMKDWNV